MTIELSEKSWPILSPFHFSDSTTTCEWEVYPNTTSLFTQPFSNYRLVDWLRVLDLSWMNTAPADLLKRRRTAF